MASEAQYGLAFRILGCLPIGRIVARRSDLPQVVMATQDGSRWESMTWKRCLETSGPDGRSIPAKGAGGETSSICMPGELTDRGRETSLAFGKSLRQRYVDQLSLLPKHLSDAEILYVRTTEVPRVIESVQQVLHGLYPWSCARLAELTRAFSRAAAEKWNGSDEMRYLSEKLGKWMPGNKAVAVDSRPSLSAIMDTINATLAHGPDTRLPDEFYDERVRRVIDRIVVDEMFHGYSLSRELRMLGAGQLVGDMVLKMVDQVEWNRRYNMLRDPTLRSRAPPRLSLLGCHDRTIGIVLASLGCLDSNEKWPPFTSHIIFELFRKRRTPSLSMKEGEQQRLQRDATTSLTPITDQGSTGEPRGIGRRPVKKLTTEEVHELDEYFVRVRYNDRIMTIPGCRAEGKHFNGDASLCSLVTWNDREIGSPFTFKSLFQDTVIRELRAVVRNSSEVLKRSSLMLDRENDPLDIRNLKCVIVGSDKETMVESGQYYYVIRVAAVNNMEGWSDYKRKGVAVLPTDYILDLGRSDRKKIRIL
ncbi:hypothetical protein NUW58_g3550 [Xylaria curta]|uniref:Uncharacterized protein n=1 Tax=Xylaria curta TaxID=42375 RepID=A0ACC1PC53_9PEZI|nr:hypothetical protein NUW58_g3550 [Xylaria curta]